MDSRLFQSIRWWSFLHLSWRSGVGACSAAPVHKGATVAWWGWSPSSDRYTPNLSWRSAWMAICLWADTTWAWGSPSATPGTTREKPPLRLSGYRIKTFLVLGPPFSMYTILHAIWTPSPLPLFACHMQWKCIGELTPPPSPSVSQWKANIRIMI